MDRACILREEETDVGLGLWMSRLCVCFVMDGQQL